MKSVEADTWVCPYNIFNNGIIHFWTQNTAIAISIHLKKQMKTADKKKALIKQLPDEDTTKYIDYSKPLNFKQLLKASNTSFKKKTKKAA
jgi:hypothetical protein